MGLFRQLPRRSFYTAAAVSTLLLLATLFLWPLSHDRQLYASYGTADGDQYAILADSGRAEVEYNSGFGPRVGWQFDVDPPQWRHWSYLSTPNPDLSPPFITPTFLGVGWHHLRPGTGRKFLAVLVPFSYLALLLAILPLLAFRAIRRRRRVARVGLCGKCGYDLRAHAIGEKCPECGTQKKG